MDLSAAPLTGWTGEVIPDWLDEFGHVNIAHYLTICDQANWAVWNALNAPETRMEDRGGQEYVIVENHVCYLDELRGGERVSVTTQLLAHDAKRMILFHEVWTGAGVRAATNEAKFLAFDLEARRAATWRPAVAAALERLAAVHDGLPRPAEAGRAIALSPRR